MTKRNAILLGIILVKFLLQYLLIHPVYDLHRDEYLHLDQARHLAWGFESVPPFTSWISWIILQLGNGSFWVKFFPALFGALTTVVVWKTIEKLNGGLFALVMGAIAVTISSLLRINILFQPNSFDILSWTFVYYCFICYIKTDKNSWLYLGAVAFALGLLNKYNIVFLMAGLLPAVILTATRKVFLNKHLYLAITISLLLVLPNLSWQYNNNFPVIHHMKELAETQLVNVQRMDFLKEQSLFFFNSIFVLIAALIAFFTYPPFRKFRVFFLSLVFTLAAFTYLKAKGYYAIGLYPILLAFGAVYIEWLTRNKGKIWLRLIAILIPLLLFIPAIQRAFPLKSPVEIVRNSKGKLHRWEDGKEYAMPQDFADMLGWRELAAKTDSIYLQVTDKAHTLVLCDNYGQAGAINFYTKLNIRAVSLNADYINWFNFENETTHVISIKEAGDELNIERNLFAKMTHIGTIQNPYAREKGTKIFLLSEPKVKLNDLLKEEIRKRSAY